MCVYVCTYMCVYIFMCVCVHACVWFFRPRCGTMALFLTHSDHHVVFSVWGMWLRNWPPDPLPPLPSPPPPSVPPSPAKRQINQVFFFHFCDRPQKKVHNQPVTILENAEDFFFCVSSRSFLINFWDWQNVTANHSSIHLTMKNMIKCNLSGV